jgi:hypothetical protein
MRGILTGIAIVIVSAVLCAPASAGSRQFAGELAVNGADVTIEAQQKDHRIRRITDFEVTDNAVGGIPVECTVIGETYLGYPGTYHPWKVGRDRRFSVAGQEQTDFVGLEIEGRFSKDRRRVTGMLVYDGAAFEKPWYCHTDGSLAWSAVAPSR